MSNEPKKRIVSGPVGVAIERVTSWFGALSKPARILLFSTSALAAILASYFGYRETHEPYAVLFAQLEQDDAGAIAAKLKELNAPYRVAMGGGAIEVPESRVGDLRLELAGAGLPRGGGVGFESFDKMKLGATEFEQRVLYRRSLEGELSRTIGTLSAVQSSRIHLVMPEKSVFVARAEPASASIVVRLRPGRTLGPSEVSAIVHLTAASVPGLAPDRVALLTTDGQMLRKPHGASDGTASGEDEDQGSRQHAIEAQLEEHARLMLEKVVGAGHVDVRVTAELDSARVERVEDHYDPTKTVLRSEETSLERGGTGLDDGVTGVPGAESNLPNGAAPAAAAVLALAAKGDAGAPRPAVAANAKGTGDQPFRESHTRNYEVDHISEKRILERGALKRLAVAVILDGIPRVQDGKTTLVPRDRADLARLEALVRSAVGASEARGDVVTVDSIPFEEDKTLAEAPAPVVVSGLSKKWRPYLPAAVAATALLIAAVGFMAVRARRNRQAEAVAQILPPVALAQQIAGGKPTVDVRAAAIERAAADPATAALVLRAWLGTSADADAHTAVSRS